LPYDALKTTDKIMHERMATRPFQNYDAFDTGTYTSYGCKHYDKGENEMEGGPPTLALKGKSLRSVSKPTEEAAAPQVSPSAPPSGRKEKAKEKAKETEPQLFVALAKQGLWQEAFRCADKYIKVQFTQPGGYEMRSLAALQLGWYQQAYDDASRALWLGSKHSSAYLLRAKAANKLKQLVHLNTKSI
jgi:tetratricopeptide (TPR) repeat protein